MIQLPRARYLDGRIIGYETEHLEFQELLRKPRTSVFQINSKYDGGSLGKVLWYGRWSQYVFEPHQSESNSYIWSRSCLNDLTSFLEHLKKDREKHLRKMREEKRKNK
jgi:hypothetical protein